MNETGKKDNNWIVKLISLPLLGYTIYRTVELLSLTLPPDNWWVGLAALFALDIGVVGWAHYYTHNAQSEDQERIALGMIWLCITGVGLAMFGDTFYQTSHREFVNVKSDFTFWAIVVQGIIIMANIVAGVFVPIISPGARLKREERRIYHDIEVKKLEAIKNNAQTLANEAAQVHGAHWLEQQRAQLRPYQLDQPSAPVIPEKPRSTPLHNPVDTFSNNFEAVTAPYVTESVTDKKPKQKECAYCGETFTTTRADARYCKDACRTKASRERGKVADL
jgi:hypothetical protein